MTHKLSILLFLAFVTLGCKNNPPANVAAAITINDDDAKLMGIELTEIPTEADSDNYIQVSLGEDVVLKYSGLGSDQVEWYVAGTPLSNTNDQSAIYRGADPGMKEVKAILANGEKLITYIMVEGVMPRSIEEPTQIAESSPTVTNTNTNNNNNGKIKDRDGDGIPDDEDDCPSVRGSRADNGCPSLPGSDRDGDGIPDSVDKCPDVKGVFANNGCPPPPADRDGDGVLDKDDKCPDEKGSKQYNGCPPPPADRDGDGVLDKDDKCPDEKGSKEYGGCLPPPSFNAKNSGSVCSLTSLAALDDEKVTSGSGSITIKPSQDLILFEAKLVSNGHGKIDISIEGGDLKKEVSITKSVNPGYTTIRLNDFKNIVLRAGKTYTLIYQTQGDIQVTQIKNAYSSGSSDSRVVMSGKNIFYDVKYKY